jgi:hypothetical protein
VVDNKIPEGLSHRSANMTATMAIILRGKLKNHLSLILDDILPSPIIIREAPQINESHPAKERSGVSTTEMFSAGTLYPVRNDNPKNRDPIKTAPPNATAISLPFDLLSMSGNELGVSGLPKKLWSKISINSKGGKQKA